MRTVLAAAIAGLLLLGCGDSKDRQEARQALIDQLVESGLADDVAECIVSGFFEVRTDAELRAFYERDSLTADEREEFGRLTRQCVDE